MNTPEITGTRYVLAVKNLAASAEYYQVKLGFKTIWTDNENWHFLSRDKFIVMLGECPSDRSAFETDNHSYFAYINILNIDALYEELKAKGVDIGSPVEDKSWGQREFSIRTIDGHRIMFGESIEKQA